MWFKSYLNICRASYFPFKYAAFLFLTPSFHSSHHFYRKDITAYMFHFVLCLLLVGCHHSTGPGGQRKDLPVDQRAVQSWDQGKCPPGAQQKEGICAGPGSHALALLWHYSGTAAGHWGAQTLDICFICTSTPHCCRFCACIYRKLLISIRRSIPQHWQHTSRTEFVMHLLSSSV